MRAKLRRKASIWKHRLRKRLGLPRPVVPARRVEGPELAVPEAPAIVLLKLDEIGDMLLALGAVSVLREAWPKADLTLVTTRQGASAAQLMNVFDHVHVLSVPKQDFAGALGGVMTGKTACDLAIDLRHDDDTRPLLDLVPARIRAGFATRRRGREVTMQIVLPMVEKRRGDFPDMANEDRLKLLAQHVVNTLKPKPPGLRLGSPHGRPAGRYVVMAPGASRDIKRWPEARFAELAGRIVADRDLDIRLVGGGAEAALCERIAAGLPAARCEILLDRPLEEVAHLIRAAQAYVGNDTGITHLAAMLDVPGVCVFSGWANLPVWRARGRGMVTLYSPQHCAPCRVSDLGRCHFDHACMTDITLDDVWAELERMTAPAELRVSA